MTGGCGQPVRDIGASWLQRLANRKALGSERYCAHMCACTSLSHIAHTHANTHNTRKLIFFGERIHEFYWRLEGSTIQNRLWLICEMKARNWEWSSRSAVEPARGRCADHRKSWVWMSWRLSVTESFWQMKVTDCIRWWAIVWRKDF